MSKKLLLNSLSGTTLYVANVAVAFVMSPVYIRALGNRDYGLWELVMSVIGYMGLLDLGVGTALVRFVAVADGKANREDLQKTISTAFVFFSIVAGIASLLFFLLSNKPELIAGKETSKIANLSIVFILLGINACMLFPLQVFTATLMGIQRHYYINCVRLVLLVLNAFLNYFLLQHYIGYGLVVMAIVTPTITLVQFILFAGAIWLDKTIPPISLKAVTRNKVTEIFSFGGKTAILMVASRLQNLSVVPII